MSHCTTEESSLDTLCEISGQVDRLAAALLDDPEEGTAGDVRTIVVLLSTLARDVGEIRALLAGERIALNLRPKEKE